MGGGGVSFSVLFFVTQPSEKALKVACPRRSSQVSTITSGASPSTVRELTQCICATEKTYAQHNIPVSYAMNHSHTSYLPIRLHII